MRDWECLRLDTRFGRDARGEDSGMKLASVGREAAYEGREIAGGLMTARRGYGEGSGRKMGRHEGGGRQGI